jgi:hypothetical protein
MDRLACHFDHGFLSRPKLFQPTIGASIRMDRQKRPSDHSKSVAYYKNRLRFHVEGIYAFLTVSI